MFTSVQSNYSYTTLKIYDAHGCRLSLYFIKRRFSEIVTFYNSPLGLFPDVPFDVLSLGLPVFPGACSVCYFCGCIPWFSPFPPLLLGAVWKLSTPFCVSSSDASITSMWLLAVLLWSHTAVPYPTQQDFFPCELPFPSPCTDLHSSHSSPMLITLHSSNGCPWHPWRWLCFSPAISKVMLPAHGALFPTFCHSSTCLPVCSAGCRVRAKCQTNFFCPPDLKECHEMEFEHQKIFFCWGMFELWFSNRH